VLKSLNLVVLLTFFIVSIGYSSQSVSLMSYNVENLFDATDDGVKQEDPAFIPLILKRKWQTDRCKGVGGYFGRMCRELDWIQPKYDARLKNISNILLSYDGQGADIIMLYEIENARVMHDLWQSYLEDWGYEEPFHFESPSSRGIDVGVISRLQLAEAPIAHRVDLDDMNKTTRDVIEATYELNDGSLLRVAANHWPSPGSSTLTRIRAAEVVREIAYRSIEDEISFVAVGDFNTLLEETPNPISDYLADNDLSDLALPLVDLQNYLKGYATFPYAGTHVYKEKWNPLDRVLVSKDIISETGDFTLEAHSFDVFQLDGMLTNVDPNNGQKRPYFFPHRYDFFSGTGYSDHMPLVVKLRSP
jgi:endonuclease/exonuclease/phosphatase family metal-dependent hydrolase